MKHWMLPAETAPSAHSITPKTEPPLHSQSFLKPDVYYYSSSILFKHNCMKFQPEGKKNVNAKDPRSMEESVIDRAEDED